MSLTDRSAIELLSLLRAGGVSSVEVVQSHLDAIAERDRELHAVAVPRFEQALEEAAAVDRGRAGGRSPGPLGGLPITVKECYDLVGTPTTAGASHLARQPSGRDAAVVAALRKAGAIVLAKTNLGQLCWSLETSNPIYGRTENPWDLTRTPGGSSGGEGAAVSARLSPVGIGTDSGGSVRIPAHYCGIHSLKPTSLRLSSEGTVDELLLSFQPVIVNQPGVLARSVRDLRLVYELLAASPEAAATRATGFGNETAPTTGRRPGSPPPRVTARVIGWFVGGLRPCSAAIERVLSEAVRALESAGAEVRPFEPPSLARAKELLDATFALDRGAMLRAVANHSELDPLVEAALSDMTESPVQEPLRSVGPLLDGCEEYRRDFARALDASGVDVLVCPPSGVAAHPHGMSPSLDGMAINTELCNLLGMPAGIVSLSRVRSGEEQPRSVGVTDPAAAVAARGSAGLPLSVQVAGRHWEETAVLEVMELLETLFRDTAEFPSAPPVVSRTRHA